MGRGGSETAEMLDGKNLLYGPRMGRAQQPVDLGLEPLQIIATDAELSKHSVEANELLEMLSRLAARDVEPKFQTDFALYLEASKKALESMRNRTTQLAETKAELDQLEHEDLTQSTDLIARAREVNNALAEARERQSELKASIDGSRKECKRQIQLALGLPGEPFFLDPKDDPGRAELDAAEADRAHAEQLLRSEWPARMKGDPHLNERLRDAVIVYDEICLKLSQLAEQTQKSRQRAALEAAGKQFEYADSAPAEVKRLRQLVANKLDELEAIEQRDYTKPW